MSGETEQQVSGWTVDTLMEYGRALRIADHRFSEERDRRYAEVALEREKALKIKETGDRDALELARQIQTYKDEQHNGIVQQMDRLQATYATKSEVAALGERFDTALAPVLIWVASQQGQATAAADARSNQYLSNGQLLGVVGAIVGLLSLVAAVIIAVR